MGILTRDKGKQARMGEFSMIATPIEAKREATDRRGTDKFHDRHRRLTGAVTSIPRPRMVKRKSISAREHQDALPPECYFG